MNNSTIKLAKDVTINNSLGLHARAATKIAGLVKNAKANIWIVKDGQKADAASIIEILTLGCEQGAKISIVVDDQSDANILTDLVKLVENGFGE
jgi:phosphotransferase system HPr (HPr) family protein